MKKLACLAAALLDIFDISDVFVADSAVVESSVTDPQ